MQTLWPRVRGLLLFGWCVALLRFGAESSFHPATWRDPTWYLSVYLLMPIAFLVVGFRGTLDDLRWPKIALISLLCGVLLWGIPNFITYTTAQFAGWTHGRFQPPMYDAAGKRIGGHGPPIGETALAKIGWGAAVGGGTTLFGTAACLVTTTLFIWLPGVVRRKRKHQSPM